jgi:hypothetical protein
MERVSQRTMRMLLAHEAGAMPKLLSVSERPNKVRQCKACTGVGLCWRIISVHPLLSRDCPLKSDGMIALPPSDYVWPQPLRPWGNKRNSANCLSGSGPKEVRMATDDRIVAIGLLTAREVGMFGRSLKHVFAVEDDDKFAELLEALDRLDLNPRAKG